MGIRIGGSFGGVPQQVGGDAQMRIPAHLSTHPTRPATVSTIQSASPGCCHQVRVRPAVCFRQITEFVRRFLIATGKAIIFGCALVMISMMIIPMGVAIGIAAIFFRIGFGRDHFRDELVNPIIRNLRAIRGEPRGINRPDGIHARPAPPPDNAFPHLQVQQATLHLAPRPIDRQNLEQLANQVTDIQELVLQAEHILPDDHSLRRRLEAYITFARSRLSPQERVNDYFDGATFQLLLKGIILEMRKSDGLVPRIQKQIALQELGEASAHGCPPRKFEEAQRQYRRLRGELDPRERLLTFIQQFKEEIFLEQFQTSQFHILNHARRLVGNELGLDTSANNLNDHYAGLAYRRLTRDRYLEVFHQHYTPGRIVSGIKDRINAMGHYDQELGVYLNRYLADHPVRNANGEEVDPATYFYNEHGLINDQGTILLLKSIGILADRTS